MNTIKCIVFVTIVGLGILAGCVSSSRDRVTPSKEITVNGYSVDISTVIIENHKYIVATGYGRGSITHSESCLCRGDND